MSATHRTHRHRADHPAPPPGARHSIDDPDLAALRGRTLRLARGFVVANAVCLAVTLLLACTADGLLATEVIGRVNLGTVLGVFQGLLLLWTAASYDRRSAKHTDPVADGLRAGYIAPRQQPAPTDDWNQGGFPNAFTGGQFTGSPFNDGQRTVWR